jgi:RNA polymerase sigma factor (sigma-70 family)
MRAYAGGDARAFEQLYERHRAALYRFVRRLLGSALAAQADEVFQDTWMRVIHARDRWQPQGASFRTWLFTLAHHRAVDLLRQSGREVSIDGAVHAESDIPRDLWQPAGDPWAGWPHASFDLSGDTGSDACDTAFWRAAGKRLLACLEELPLPQKTVFLLHHEDGLPLDELARGLELGFETAKSRLRYAMHKLRVCMGAYLPAAPP